MLGETTRKYNKNTLWGLSCSRPGREVPSVYYIYYYIYKLSNPIGVIIIKETGGGVLIILLIRFLCKFMSLNQK